MKFTLLAMLAILATMAMVWADSNGADADAKAADIESLRQAAIALLATAEAQELDKLVAYFLDDALFMAPNAPALKGKAAIREVLSHFFEIPGFSIKWQPTYVEISSSGDLGYTIGTNVMTFDGPNGKPIVDNGKYTTIWKKDADGTWKVAVDMFNTNMPLPTAEKEE